MSRTRSDEADHQLLERARSGDGHALDALLERHQDQVYRFGMRMCRDPEDARDVLQDTLLAMVRGVRDFREASSISTWLYTIARSFCIKKRRRSKFAPQPERSLDGDAAPEVARIASEARAPDEALVAKQVESAVERAIDALKPLDRDVLILRDVEGLTASEVAEMLGMSAQAVKSRLHRARLSVRAKVAPVLGVPTQTPATGSCPNIVETFSRHLEDEISAEVCAEMERHLSGCGSCRGACESLKRTLALCGMAGRSHHVPLPVQASVKTALRNLLAAEPFSDSVAPTGRRPR